MDGKLSISSVTASGNEQRRKLQLREPTADVRLCPLTHSAQGCGQTAYGVLESRLEVGSLPGGRPGRQTGEQILGKPLVEKAGDPEFFDAIRHFRISAAPVRGVGRVFDSGGGRHQDQAIEELRTGEGQSQRDPAALRVPEKSRLGWQRFGDRSDSLNRDLKRNRLDIGSTVTG